MSPNHRRLIQVLTGLFCTGLIAATIVAADDRQKPFSLTLQYQLESSGGSGRFHQFTRQQKWKPEETAIIVCDVWDLHHCLNAVRRLEQFAPRLDAVLKQARDQGATIIHSPSDCMSAYEGHPARQRASEAPGASWVPHEVGSWCSVIPTEERGSYPIDQSDGGEDDDPQEHARWAAQLKAMGRNPGTPWKTQSDLITIDADRDFISDKGDEVWNVLESRGIRNVILTGVHLNMCVLGRPFGLRQMVRNGKNVVLMRDMTDVMYNPQRWPYVSHLTAIDLVVDHVERFVCPTVSSDQIIGGVPFRFAEDHRPHLAIVMAEDEYETNSTLPDFAIKHLGRTFRVTTIYGSDQERHRIPAFPSIAEADAVLISIRRRVLPPSDMQVIRDFVAAGKPVIGIRTASHAFSLGRKQTPDGFSDWPEFDAQVFGGNYHGHLGNSLVSIVQTEKELLHPILRTVTREPFQQGYSLYNVMPLAKGTTVLATAKADGHPAEPVAWTYQRADGGRSFYTSMGHPRDFASIHFQQLLLNGIHWAVGLNQPSAVHPEGSLPESEQHWVTVEIPEATDTHAPAEKNADQPSRYRCVVRIPESWTGTELLLQADPSTGIEGLYINGKPIDSADGRAIISRESVNVGDANLLTIRTGRHARLLSAPKLIAEGHWTIHLAGRWQHRTGKENYSNMPLPSKFGGSSDIVYSPREPLYVARPVTVPGEFTGGIEGPACNADGDVFAVNFAMQGTIGRVRESGEGEIFVRLPEGSVGNGIRFGQDGSMFVADYAQHNILRINPKDRTVKTFAHNPMMNQPNDLAIGSDGTLWASDPNWPEQTGQIWRIDPDGSTTLAVPDLGTTNGIEVSPDGKTLYVNESVQRNIWAFTINDDKSLSNRRLFRKFDDHGFDGHRCDARGNLYVTRYGKGTVVKLSPEGEILQEINVLGSRPSNLCFGGPDGKTIYVTEVEHTRLVRFRVDEPGAAWTRW